MSRAGSLKEKPDEDAAKANGPARTSPVVKSGEKLIEIEKAETGRVSFFCWCAVIGF